MRKFHLLLVLLIASAPAAAQVPPYVPQNNLVGWWPFTGNADDQSGNAHHGTATGAVLAPDRFGTTDRAYAFDGTDDYVEVADAAVLRFNEASFTIAWWARLDAYTAPATAFVNKRGTGSQNGWMLVANSLNEYKIEMKVSGGADGAVFCDSIIDPGAWFHFTVVQDATVDSMFFFVNGEVATAVSSEGFSFNPGCTAPMRFGSDTSTPEGTYYLQGAMDDIGIWERRLTAQEVLDLFLNTNVSVMEHAGSDIRVIFDAAGRELVMQLPTQLIGTGYRVVDAGGRVVATDKVKGEVMHLPTKGWVGVYLVRFDAEPGAAVRVVLP